MRVHPQFDEVFVAPKQGGAREGAGRKPGVPNERKRLPGEKPLYVLNRQEEKTYWRKLLAQAVKEKNVREWRSVLQYLNEMRRGKPFDAVNPRAVKQTPSDNRLMVAIQNILPDGGKGLSKAKLLKAKKVEDE